MKNSEYVKMPVNISLWKGYSLGESIARGRKITNYISFNIPRGRASRLRGIELGVFSNEYSENVIGIQAAGLANIVEGGGAGIQGAGLANVVSKDFTGIQAGGLGNVVGGDFIGIQAGGLASVVSGDSRFLQAGGLGNVVDGDFIGIQASGLANVVNGDAQFIQASGLGNVVDGGFIGVQASGLVNVVNSDTKFIQAAGLGNVVGGDFIGIQASGLVNVVNGEGTGIQISGLGNVIDDDFTGIQACGLVNVASGTFTGIQLSGLGNVTKNVAFGLQIGLFNVSADRAVIPVGLVSRVEDVPAWYDIWVDETGFINAGYRSGTDYFHNLVFIGAQASDTFRWTVGWGLGGHVQVGTSHFVDIDAQIQHISEEDIWTDRLNELGRFRIIGGWKVRDSVSIYAGPTLNYLVSRVNDGSDLASWSIHEEYSGNRWKRLWPGFVIGVRFER